MEIVSAKEKLSIFQKTCPVLPTKVALLCAVLNLIPGKIYTVNLHLLTFWLFVDFPACI